MSGTAMPFSSTGFEKMPLTMEQLGEMLKKTQLGRGMGLEEIRALASFMDAYQGSAKSIICREGEESSFMCAVCRGRVDIVKEDLGHRDKVIASLVPSNSLGEMSMVDGEPRSATVVVQTPVELLVLTKERYERLSDENPRLWGKLVVNIAAVLSKRLRRTSGVLAEYLES